MDNDRAQELRGQGRLPVKVVAYARAVSPTKRTPRP